MHYLPSTGCERPLNDTKWQRKNCFEVYFLVSDRKLQIFTAANWSEIWTKYINCCGYQSFWKRHAAFSVRGHLHQNWHFQGVLVAFLFEACNWMLSIQCLYFWVLLTFGTWRSEDVSSVTYCFYAVSFQSWEIFYLQQVIVHLQGCPAESAAIIRQQQQVVVERTD